jgi:hypothetical protein
LLALLGRQFLAALETAAAQYVLAGFTGHTLKEAVFMGAVTFLGLVGSLWHSSLYLLVWLFSEINNNYVLNFSKFSTFIQVFSTVFSGVACLCG